MTLKELRQQYSRYRRKFFVGCNLPPAKRLRFRWATEETWLALHSELACLITHGDGKQDLEFHPQLKSPWLRRLALLVLLHEMAHLKNPKADHGPWFEEEAVRLGAAGAMREFWV